MRKEREMGLRNFKKEKGKKKIKSEYSIGEAGEKVMREDA